MTKPMTARQALTRAADTAQIVIIARGVPTDDGSDVTEAILALRDSLPAEQPAPTSAEREEFERLANLIFERTVQCGHNAVWLLSTDWQTIERALRIAARQADSIVRAVEVVCGPDDTPASGYCAVNGCAVMSHEAVLVTASRQCAEREWMAAVCRDQYERRVASDSTTPMSEDYLQGYSEACDHCAEAISGRPAGYAPGDEERGEQNAAGGTSELSP
ncbi:MAG: hypothetical protein ACYDBH_00310 [Acidobacteriaceae bacterium]